MKTNSLFIINARLPDGTQADIGVSDGLITGVFPAASAAIDKSSSILDASGALVLPSFFDGHNHTDKTFMGVPWVPHKAGPDRTDRIETEKRSVGIDIHLHEPGEIGILSVRSICEKTKASGLNGKVTISHGFCLGMVNDALVKETASIMAEAGVSL